MPHADGAVSDYSTCSMYRHIINSRSRIPATSTKGKRGLHRVRTPREGFQAITMEPVREILSHGGTHNYLLVVVPSQNVTHLEKEANTMHGTIVGREL